MQKKSLPQVTSDATRLGEQTIMDRALAAQHGVPYVHLAAFAIDVDRVFVTGADTEQNLPLGWEVLLVLAYVVNRLDTSSEACQSMLEDAAQGILSAPKGAPLLGGVLAFALQAGSETGLLHNSLQRVFRGWRGTPKQLRKSLETVLPTAQEHVRRAAIHCAGTSIEPPLTPPTLVTLQGMIDGEFPIPSVATTAL